MSGDVVEIGLVRLYLMELIGEEGDLHATGRVVGFSNSVLFQPAASFRQVPGTDYVWHTVTLILAPESDPQLAENASETDGRVIKALSDAIAHDPRLALAGSGALKLQSAV